ncbi:MAG TPA: hypothetical protein VL588_04150 [Bdellovibrionota bacterium]|nr:hypothetical protein [Bdellovibrionota bacterium]
MSFRHSLKVLGFASVALATFGARGAAALDVFVANPQYTDLTVRFTGSPYPPVAVPLLAGDRSSVGSVNCDDTMFGVDLTPSVGPGRGRRFAFDDAQTCTETMQRVHSYLSEVVGQGQAREVRFRLNLTLGTVEAVTLASVQESGPPSPPLSDADASEKQGKPPVTIGGPGSGALVGR